MAGRPPKNAIETAIVNDANSPTRGSTPAMIENEIASGINASATISPPSTSIRKRRGLRKAAHTVSGPFCATTAGPLGSGEEVVKGTPDSLYADSGSRAAASHPTGSCTNTGKPRRVESYRESDKGSGNPALAPARHPDSRVFAPQAAATQPLGPP